MERSNSFLTTPILGSVVISIAILMHGGIIKIALKQAGNQAVAPVPSVAPPSKLPSKLSSNLLQPKYL